MAEIDLNIFNCEAPLTAPQMGGIFRGSLKYPGEYSYSGTIFGSFSMDKARPYTHNKEGLAMAYGKAFFIMLRLLL